MAARSNSRIIIIFPMTKNVPIHLILTKKVRALEEKQLAAGRKLTSTGKIIITYTSALSSLIRINIVS